MIQFGVRMQYAVAGFDLYRHVDVFQIKIFDMYNLIFSIFNFKIENFSFLSLLINWATSKTPSWTQKSSKSVEKWLNTSCLIQKYPWCSNFRRWNFRRWNFLPLKFPPAEISAAQISVLKFPRSKFPANSSGYRILQICLKFKKCISQLHALFSKNQVKAWKDLLKRTSKYVSNLVAELIELQTCNSETWVQVPPLPLNLFLETSCSDISFLHNLSKFKCWRQILHALQRSFKLKLMWRHTRQVTPSFNKRSQKY